jgi:KUP system potassium uptake protein
VRTTETPRVREEDRVTIEKVNDDFKKVFINYGFMESPNVPKALALARRRGEKFDIMTTSFFLNRRSFRPARNQGLPFWQERLFIAMSKSASDATAFYCLPSNRVVEMGQQISI